MVVKNFIYCPRCRGNTHVKVDSNTKLMNFPLWCKKCKKETIIDFENGVVKCGKKGK